MDMLNSALTDPGELEVRDFLGTKVEVGSRVCVALSLGRGAQLRVGRIVSIIQPKESNYGWETRHGQLEIEWEAGTVTVPTKNTKIWTRLNRFVVVA